MSKIRILCRDESKIEEILKHLFENDFDFEILGRRALLISEKAYKSLCLIDHGWFDIEKVDKFPAQCWQFGRRTARRTSSLFQKSVPDRFEPADIPPQKTRPLTSNI